MPHGRRKCHQIDGEVKDAARLEFSQRPARVTESPECWIVHHLSGQRLPRQSVSRPVSRFGPRTYSEQLPPRRRARYIAVIANAITSSRTSCGGRSASGRNGVLTTDHADADGDAAGNRGHRGADPLGRGGVGCGKGVSDEELGFGAVCDEGVATHGVPQGLCDSDTDLIGAAAAPKAEQGVEGIDTDQDQHQETVVVPVTGAEHRRGEFIE